jgi:hypothetical protein
MRKTTATVMLLLVFLCSRAYATDYTIHVHGGYFGRGIITHSFCFYQVWWAETKYGTRILVLSSRTNDALERLHRQALTNHFRENGMFTVRIPEKGVRAFEEALMRQSIVRVDVRRVLPHP